MKAAVIALLLLGFALLSLPASGQAPGGSPANWNKLVNCYGPFPTKPPPSQTGYNKTEMDIFNVTASSRNLGGIKATCGPVLQGFAKQTTSRRFNVTQNSTGLQWNESDWIIPQSVNPAPAQNLTNLFHNLTEYQYVNNLIFAKFNMTFQPARGFGVPTWAATLACYTAVYPWSFTLNASWVFTALNGAILQTNPRAVLTCTAANPSPPTITGFVVFAPYYYDFHLYKNVNATYVLNNQPRFLNKTTNLNNLPLDTAYINFSPAVAATTTTPFDPAQILLTMATLSLVLAVGSILSRKRLNSALRKLRI